MATGSRPGERRGGRTKGVPNKVNVATRERILSEGDPIGLLLAVSNGNPLKAAAADSDRTEQVEIYPSLDQMVRAAEVLAKKIMPDMKAVEHSGELGLKHESWLDRLK